MESLVRHPWANGLAERAVQTVKRALQAWNPNLIVLFGAFLQRALMTHRKTSKTSGQNSSWTPVGTQCETTRNSRFRLVRTHSIQGQWEDEDNYCYLHYQAGLEHLSYSPKTQHGLFQWAITKLRGWTMTMWKLDHQLRRPYLNQNHNFRTQMSDLHTKMKLLQPYHLQSIDNLNQQSLHEHQHETENSPTDLENLYTQTCLKKEGGCDGFKQTAWNSEVLLKFQRTKKELTWRTWSISNGHKTKLKSNSVLALSLSYWPINNMSELISSTRRNLILTFTDLQLTNSIVARPYLILKKYWWK